MKFIEKLIDPTSNHADTILDLCKQLNFKVTKSTILKELSQHPNYPSLLSVSDVLTNLGIENMAIKLPGSNLARLTAPFLAHISNATTGSEIFAVVHKLDEFTLQFFNPETNKKQDISYEHFLQIYKGTVLIAEVGEKYVETKYQEKRNVEIRENLFTRLSIFLLPLLALAGCSIAFIYVNAWEASLLLIVTLIGCLISFLLLLHEVDEHNPIIQQICQPGKKVNCSAILNSKGSKFFGISWSILGSAYFFGFFLSLVVTGITDSSVLFLLSWLNIFSLPYIFYSVYYQWKVAKQWCLLCLSILAVLVIQFLISSIGGLYSLPLSEVAAQSWLAVFTCVSISFFVINLLIKVSKKAKEGKMRTTELLRLKHNQQVFEAILSRQNSIDSSVDGLGITIGNMTNPELTIVKVCNPYCGPCAKAHPAIDQLIDSNPGLKVQILFTASGKSTDKKTPPVRHLLGLAQRDDPGLIREALDAWYLAEEKDYKLFATKFPVDNSLLQSQDEKIIAMDDWCKQNNIAFTPTFFINGYQLPKIYNINDLKYFLTS